MPRSCTRKSMVYPLRVGRSLAVADRNVRPTWLQRPPAPISQQGFNQREHQHCRQEPRRPFALETLIGPLQRTFRARSEVDRLETDPLVDFLFGKYSQV